MVRHLLIQLKLALVLMMRSQKKKQLEWNSLLWMDSKKMISMSLRGRRRKCKRERGRGKRCKKRRT
jgi:hypothetical protein